MELAKVTDLTEIGTTGHMSHPMNAEHIERMRTMVSSTLEASACIGFLRTLLTTQHPVSVKDNAEWPSLTKFVSEAIEQLVMLGLVLFTHHVDPETGMRVPQVLSLDSVVLVSVGQQYAADRGFHRVYTVEWKNKNPGKGLPPIYVIEHTEWRPSLKGELRTPLMSVIADIIEANDLRRYFIHAEKLKSEGQFAIENSGGAAAASVAGNTGSLNAYQRADELISRHQQFAQTQLAQAKTRHDTHSFVAKLKGTEELTESAQRREYEVPVGWKVSNLPVPSSSINVNEISEWASQRIAVALGVPPDLLFKSAYSSSRITGASAMRDALPSMRNTVQYLQRRLETMISKAFWFLNAPTMPHMKRAAVHMDVQDFTIRPVPLLLPADLASLRAESVLTQSEFVELSRKCYTLPDATGKDLKELEKEDEDRRKAETKQQQPAPAPKAAEPKKEKEKKETEKGEKEEEDSDRSDSESESEDETEKKERPKETSEGAGKRKKSADKDRAQKRRK